MDKRYRIFNWTVFGFVCYMAALPVFARAMRFLLPQIWRCSYLRMTGQPCPFCGTTGDLARLWHGNFDFRNPVTPLLAMFLLFELVWRSVLLLRRRLIKGTAVQIIIQQLRLAFIARFDRFQTALLLDPFQHQTEDVDRIGRRCVVHRILIRHDLVVQHRRRARQLKAQQRHHRRACIRQVVEGIRRHGHRAADSPGEQLSAEQQQVQTDPYQPAQAAVGQPHRRISGIFPVPDKPTRQ